MSSLISKRNHKKMRDISASLYIFLTVCYIVLFITWLVDCPCINTWIVNNVLSMIINLTLWRPLCYFFSVVKNAWSWVMQWTMIWIWVELEPTSSVSSYFSLLCHKSLSLDVCVATCTSKISKPLILIQILHLLFLILQ